MQAMELKTGKVQKNDFALMSVIGTGSYGKVFLVKKKNNVDKDKLYAMKVVKKSSIIKT